jgi:GNAT superfamily N-acetyltransferase
MPQVSYIFLRGLELEGRHPHDVGAWHVTVRRMEVGEGVPPPEDPARSVEIDVGAPFPPAPKVPPARRMHTFYYRRLRSVAECERYLERVEREVPVCLQLSAGWANPPGGVIPMPAAGEPLLDDTHLVVLDSYAAKDQLFRFENTWGAEWGDRGTGYLPAAYFERYVFECWVAYGVAARVEYHKLTAADDRRNFRWVARDEWERRVYGFEVWDKVEDDRRAWAFVVERDGALEIEDLYVRPEFRGKGYASVLAAKVAALARVTRTALRLWVPFADCRQEDPANYARLVATARLLGVQFQPCQVAWAAYFATNERPGHPEPIEPGHIPARPKSALQALLAAGALTTGMANLAGVAISNPPPALAASVRDDLPTVHSAEWDAMSERRSELIRKDLDEGLTGAERDEYERLQRITRAALALVYPRPKPDFEGLARLREELRAGKTRTE